MPHRGVTASGSPSAAPGRTLWIGALSFEERCTASLVSLAAAAPPADALLLEYPTDVRPVAQDRERRKRNRARVEAVRNAEHGQTAVEFVGINPYSYRAVQRTVCAKLDACRPKRVVLDVSCLTKIHTIALSDPRIFAAAVDWELAYTVPETYGHLEMSSGTGGGWRDVLVLPVGDSHDLHNEAQSRGVILAGHEGDRLVISLSETEPSAGVLVTARSGRRPDLLRESQRRNEQITRLLAARGDRWTHEVVGLDEPALLDRLVTSEAERALAAEAPVLLYPFGPKPFVALAAMQLAAREDLGAWFVYPIPTSYDVDYSYGVGATHWYARAAPDRGDAQQELPLP